MKYMLLVYDNPANWTDITEEQMKGLYAEYAAVSNDPATVSQRAAVAHRHGQDRPRSRTGRRSRPTAPSPRRRSTSAATTSSRPTRSTTP